RRPTSSTRDWSSDVCSSDLVTSDVPIYDPTISRKHAELRLTDGGVEVKDVGSSNGTFLNGARVTDALAAENDVITFGKVAFRVRSEERRVGNECRSGVRREW